MVFDPAEYVLPGIGRLLIQQGLLESNQVLACHKQALAANLPFIQYLLQQGLLSAKCIAEATAKQFDLPFLDLDYLEKDNLPSNLINKSLLSRHAMVPLYTEPGHLYLATTDPTNQEGLQEIQFHTGLSTHPIIVEADKLNRLLDKLLMEVNLDLHSSEEEVVPWVNQILLQAIKQGASDIHFELYEESYRIRYRQDGILHTVATPDPDLAARVTSRIKVLANLDITERRLPQDGGFSLRLPSAGSTDFRVSTCPTIQGEKVVIRLLDVTRETFPLESLGFTPDQLGHFTKQLAKPQGLILVTGPTGSGKTRTLYTALHTLNSSEVNIVTAEDPVEIHMPGINQVNINPKLHFDFEEALRSFLRQDPDIIMLGEIRDAKTAQVAIKAAQTGHLVLSTLHTNSAADTLDRLIHLGVAGFHLASCLSLVIAQRLARLLCEHCKTLDTDFHREDLAGIQIYKARGCSQCIQGYKGRIGLFEVLPITDKLSQLIMNGANPAEILAKAKQDGMITIFEAGLAKVKLGITSIQEINRVTLD